MGFYVITQAGFKNILSFCFFNTFSGKDSWKG